MIVELISIGTEILLGNIVNTNAAFLSEKCAALGLSVYYQVTVGDNPERLEQTVRTALDRSDIVIMSGGLGPTNDDITKTIASKVMGMELYFDENVRLSVQKYLENGPYSFIPESNFSQAYVPKGAIVLHNTNGTAPGLIMEKDNKSMILLPGPPSELKPLFNNQVFEYLSKKTDKLIRSKMLKLSGIGESQAAEMIKDMLETQTNPTIAPYAKTSEVHLRITASAKNETEAYDMLAPVEKELYKRFGDIIFTSDESVTLEEKVVLMLKEKGYKVSTVESCTGGKIASKLVNIPGSSEVFEKGFVTYSDEAKTDLVGVDRNIIEKYGVVSEETAANMACNGAKTAGTQACISVTGVAGPTGGTEKTPVGTVFIGCCLNGHTEVEKYHFSGNRENVRENAAVRALNLLRITILNEYN